MYRRLRSNLAKLTRLFDPAALVGILVLFGVHSEFSSEKPDFRRDRKNYARDDRDP
jgi:hypothetical protein